MAWVPVGGTGVFGRNRQETERGEEKTLFVPCPRIIHSAARSCPLSLAPCTCRLQSDTLPAPSWWPPAHLPAHLHLWLLLVLGQSQTSHPPSDTPTLCCVPHPGLPGGLQALPYRAPPHRASGAASPQTPSGTRSLSQAGAKEALATGPWGLGSKRLQRPSPSQPTCKQGRVPGTPLPLPPCPCPSPRSPLGPCHSSDTL